MDLTIIEQIVNIIFRPDYFCLPQEDTECQAYIHLL